MLFRSEARLHKGRAIERGAWVPVPRVDGGAAMSSSFSGTNTVFEVKSAPSGGPLIATSIDTAAIDAYEPARQRWLEPGFAEAQYLARGHRDSRWDAAVVDAHARYVATGPAGKDPHLPEIFDALLERGCKDGIVAYRAAVCATEWRHDSRGVTYFRNAAEWIPEQYPDSPYASSAAQKTAEAAEKKGDLADALLWARRAATFSRVDPSAPALLARLEELDALATIATRGAVDLRSASPSPGFAHAAPVCALHLSPAGNRLLSSDQSGYVQLSEVIPAQVFPDLNPMIRERIHSAGRTLVRWIDGDRFLSAGADGVLFSRRFGGTRSSLTEASRFVHDAAITALGPPLRGIATAGDSRGRLFAIGEDARFELVATTGRRAIVRILPVGAALIAIDDRGRIALVTTDGVSPIAGDAVLPDAVDVTHGGKLIAGVRAGLSLIDPADGTRMAVESTMRGAALCVREDSSAGRWRVIADEKTIAVRALLPDLRGTTIAREATRALDVCFAAQILASADAKHHLALSAWG